MVRLILLVLSAAALAPTCNIPVFRYALERWPADSYEVILFHRGPLTAAEQALADQRIGDVPGYFSPK